MASGKSGVDGGDGRDISRTNMFIAAMLHGESGAAPVKIRNMSPDGALAEAPTLPGAGSLIDLVRGSLRASGEVVWQAGSRCGLRFDRAIVVKDWMTPGHAGQNMLETSVVRLRSGLGATRVARTKIEEGIGGELGRLAQLIDLLGERLSRDPRILAEHGEALQTLDLAAQVSAALRDAVDDDAGVSSAGRARLRALRSSCLATLGSAAD